MTPWEWFYADCDGAELWQKAESRDDAIAKGSALFAPEPFTICEAQREALHDDVMHADQAIEAFEDFHDHILHPHQLTPDISEEAKQELAEALNAAFAAWRAKHNPWTAFAFADQRNIEVIEPETAA